MTTAPRQIIPSLEDFIQQSKEYNLIPVTREIMADLETPVSAYCKVKRGTRGFLLESVEGGEILGRYSIIGTEPELVIKSEGKRVTIQRQNKTETIILHKGEDPLSVLAGIMEPYRPYIPPASSGSASSLYPVLPPFYGGFVGYVGYDTVSFFEPVQIHKPNDLGVPDSLFVLADTILVFDRIRHTIQIIANVQVDDDPEQSYQKAISRIDEIETRLNQPLQIPVFGAGVDEPITVTNSRTKEEYCEAVRRAKDYIMAGDAFQIVLSMHRMTEIHASPLDLYRALRRLNPSPYLFLLENEECALIGSSPEILVKLVDGQVKYRPIAGTRPRGKTPQEDQQLAQELLADPKERAEHIMLVDLGRNDVGRVCDYDSVRVTDLMVVERYSHVMHIVSNVEGTLSADKTPFDLLRATFPAGTLTGAPKIRAMQIIDELEPTRRGPYGGAVGYLGFNGNMDTCITIRTILFKDHKATVQAGAGIVYDSQPESEYQECINKSQALLQAIRIAESGKFGF